MANPKSTSTATLKSTTRAQAASKVDIDELRATAPRYWRGRLVSHEDIHVADYSSLRQSKDA